MRGKAFVRWGATSLLLLSLIAGFAPTGGSHAAYRPIGAALATVAAPNGLGAASRLGVTPAGEPTAAQPPAAPALHDAPAVAVSPAGGWVATGLHGLTLASPRSVEMQQTTDAPVRDLSWSPHGEWLLAGLVGGEVILLRTDGRSQILDSRIVQGMPDGHLLVAWAPDGHQVLVTAAWGATPLGSQAWPIWAITPETGAARVVAQLGRVVGLHWLADDQALLLQAAGCCGVQAGRLDLATGAWTNLDALGSVAVHPDGRRLAYAAYQGGQVTVWDLKSDRRQVSGTTWTASGGPLGPGATPSGGVKARVLSWSPDGHTLAYVGAPLAGIPDENTLYTVDFTWDEEPLTAPAWASQWEWLGDGHDLLYTSRTGRGIQVNLNGVGLAQHDGGLRLGLLGADPIAVRSPDGRYLAYTVEAVDHTSRLVTVDLATGTVQEQPDSAGQVPLAWTADGAHLWVGEASYRQTDLGNGASDAGWELTGLKHLPAPTAGASGAGDPVVAAPLWGPPGTRVMPAQVYGSTPLTQTYAPIPFPGRTLQPVNIGWGTYLFRQEGDAVYVDGYRTWAGTLVVYDQPRLLYRLPVTLGTTFTLMEEHSIGMGPRQYRVVGFASVDTPVGRFPTVVIVGPRGREWWAPGVGPVKRDDAVAARITTGEPEVLPVAAQLDANTTAYLTGALQVRDQDGQMLLALEAHPLRSTFWWANVGAPAPLLLYEAWSPAEPHNIQQAYTWDPAAHHLTPVRWRLPDGREKSRMAGFRDGTPVPGALKLLDEEHYPTAWCTFRWDGQRMACAAYEGGKPIQEERLFAQQLTRPLDEESWARMFVDPTVGRQAYQQTRRPDAGNMLAYTDLRKSDDTWIAGRSPQFRFSLVRRNGEWQVATWQQLP